MAILKIARMGHPILSKISTVITDIYCDKLNLLITDMVETMDDAGGAGLAAPQVHMPIRLVIYRIKSDENLTDDNAAMTLHKVINPVITPIGDDISYDWEGCLSIPDLTGLVGRYENINLMAQLPNGNDINMNVSGFHARVLQHECDHLDGILYPQRMDDLSLLMFTDQMRHGISDNAKRLIEKNKMVKVR